MYTVTLMADGQKLEFNAERLNNALNLIAAFADIYDDSTATIKLSINASA